MAESLRLSKEKKFVEKKSFQNSGWQTTFNKIVEDPYFIVLEVNGLSKSV